MSPTADTDFTITRLISRADDDLANGIGNAVSRVTSLGHRFRAGIVADTGAEPLAEASGLTAAVHRALADFDRRTGTALIAKAVAALNRDLEHAAPWVLARDGGTGFDRRLDTYVRTLACVADALRPIAPDLAARIAARVDRGAPLAAGPPVFPRIAGSTTPGRRQRSRGQGVRT